MSDTKFKVGDHVRVKAGTNLDDGRHEGKTGVVLTVPGGTAYYHRVRLDDGTYDSLFLVANEIEHVPELPDTYADQAAALREQAALIRNERDEKYAEADLLTEEADALGTRANSLTAAAIALEKIK